MPNEEILTPTPEAPTEPKTEPVAPTDEFSWYKELDPDTQTWVKEKGRYGYKKWNDENRKLVEAQKKLDAALSRLSEKPQPISELPILRARLERLVESGRISKEEASQQYLEAQSESQQPRILTEEKLEEVLSKRETEKAMRQAEKEIVEKSKGKLDEDDAFAMMNGYTAGGMDADEAKERVLGLLSGFSMEAKETAKITINKVMTPSPAPRVIVPGVTATQGAPSTSTPEEIAHKVIEMAKERAKRNS